MTTTASPRPAVGTWSRDLAAVGSFASPVGQQNLPLWGAKDSLPPSALAPCGSPALLGEFRAASQRSRPAAPLAHALPGFGHRGPQPGRVTGPCALPAVLTAALGSGLWPRARRPPGLLTRLPAERAGERAATAPGPSALSPGAGRGSRSRLRSLAAPPPGAEPAGT